MINRSSCKYEVVVEAARAMGWRIGEVGDELNPNPDPNQPEPEP